MDIQTRKLRAIGYLIELHDEKVLSKFEYPINESHKHQNIKNKINPMTLEQLTQRAKQSSTDYLSGKYKTQEQLDQESREW